MKIGVPAEVRPGETRVAASPETVKKLVGGKHTVIVQAGAGVPASFPDAAYTDPACAGWAICRADCAHPNVNCSRARKENHEQHGHH